MFNQLMERLVSRMRHRISPIDFPQLHARLRPLQGSVKLVFLHHEREGASHGFGFSFGTEDGLRARQLRLIELEMCVSTRGAVSHGLSPLNFDVSLHSGC